MLDLLGHAVGLLSGRESSGVAARFRGALRGLHLNATGLRIGTGVEIVGPRDRFAIGSRVALLGHSYLNATGPTGRIAIGNDSHVDQFCVLYGQGGLTIGARCAIAAGTIIYTQSNQYGEDPLKDIIAQPVVYAPVTIGTDVWIGARAVILPGVAVGDHAIIGAGAVVRGDVEPWTIVAGVPAKVVGDRREARRTTPT